VAVVAQLLTGLARNARDLIERLSLAIAVREEYGVHAKDDDPYEYDPGRGPQPVAASSS
jgi:hypothetical protein